ncbi:hypothetical protein [Rhizobium sp. BG4]|uniref:hypothetical protein n=1 Tax=Rhizobium sp. BG4 TaxID=2613770 RepID=UPI00193DDD86|nr:hypothetical protein [Rhizobium sp. BG4]QRM46015.1 hypothetical protein F2982_21605 [Rhizobium sp. BG4]
MNRQLSAREIKDISRTNTTPINIPRSTRQVNQNAATSMPAGKMVPLDAFPLLREDALRNSMMTVRVDLMETAEIIKNAIQCRVMAYFVPFLAFARFNGGMDEFNRSYMKQNIADGATVTPFFNSQVAGAAGSIPIHKYLGFHAGAADTINTAYIEAYNIIWNFRARNRSETLFQAKKRLETATSLAPAFWQHEQFKYVVPDWDDIAMEGQVDLTFTNALAPIKGLGTTVPNAQANIANVKETGGGTRTYASASMFRDASSANFMELAAGVPQVFANLAAAGVKISLANIELAKKTQWYAELKAQFEGIPDNYVIDLLMQGVNVPDQMWKQPILIADKTQVFGIEKRWATDGANLTDAVVNGSALVDLDMVLPRCPTGGIVMIVAEIMPEQLFERMRDPLLFITDPAKLPNALRDDLDPQKVERMSKGEVDTSHSDPNGLFGYRPLNWMWQASNTRIGGKWFKSAPSTAFNEDRQHFWTVEVTDPSYNSDFMISETFNTLPFVVTNQDVGEVQIHGTAIIEGNTQFGTRLLENDNAYVEVLAQVDQSRLTKGV